MKLKLTCMFLVFSMLLISCTTITHAETNGVLCSHLTEREEREVPGFWRPLSEGSPEYGITHTRDWYLETRCSACGYLFKREWWFLEWGSHTLPCNLCGAGQ